MNEPSWDNVKTLSCEDPGRTTTVLQGASSGKEKKVSAAIIGNTLIIVFGEIYPYHSDILKHGLKEHQAHWEDMSWHGGAFFVKRDNTWVVAGESGTIGPLTKAVSEEIIRILEMTNVQP